MGKKSCPGGGNGEMVARGYEALVMKWQSSVDLMGNTVTTTIPSYK